MSNKDNCAKVARYEVTAVSDFLNRGDKAIPTANAKRFAEFCWLAPVDVIKIRIRV